MTSPDVSAYVDAVLFTRTRQDIFDEMLLEAQTAWPDWDPHEADFETVMLSIWAGQQYQLEQQLNPAPARAFEGLLRALGVVRDPGARPTVSLTIAVTNGPAQTLPAGTRLLWSPPDGSSDAQLVTLDAVVADAGVTSITASAAVTAQTTVYNGLTGGSARFVDYVPYADSVTVGLVSAGRDPETSLGFLSRGSLRLARLTSTLVHAEQFRLAALEDTDVARAFALDDYDPTAGSGAPGDHPGHTTVSVRGPGGAALSSPQKADLLAALSAEAYGPLTVHIIDSTVTPIDVEADLVRSPGYTDSQVEAAATAALTGYLNADAWPYSGTVYRFKLIALLSDIPGVDRVATLTTPAADVVLTGYGTLVAPGTLTLTTS